MIRQGDKIKKICQKCGQGQVVVPHDARPWLDDNNEVYAWSWECLAHDPNETRSNKECGSTMFFLSNNKNIAKVS